jgi:ribosome modulation factor
MDNFEDYLDIIRRHGHAAASVGKSLTDCPHEPGTHEYYAWIEGWKIAQPNKQELKNV